MQHSYPLARAGRWRLSDRFWTFGVSWRHWRLEFDLRPWSMLVVKYESYGLRLAGEVHLWRLLDRSLSRRSSDALSTRMFGRTGSATRRWRCLTVEVWNDRPTMASLATVFPTRCQRESAELMTLQTWSFVRLRHWRSATNVWLAASFSIVPC